MVGIPLPYVSTDLDPATLAVPARAKAATANKTALAVQPERDLSLYLGPDKDKPWLRQN